MSELLAQLGIDGRLLAAQAANFALVAVLLAWFVFRPIVRLMEERRRKIEQGLETAEKAERELKRAETRRQEHVEKARAEAQEIISRARKDANLQEREILRQASEKAEVLLEKAAHEGKARQEVLMRETQVELAQAALLAAERVTAERMGKKEEVRVARELKNILAHAE